MQERALQLLALPDEVLFRAGGCHVFALALRATYGLPLVWVCEDGGDYDHIACAASERRVLDFFGWFTYPEYVRAEWLDGRAIRFVPIEEAELQRRFTLVRGRGYYAHPDFFVPASERARAWIATHREIFDGTTKVAISEVSRIQRASDDEIDSAFEPRG